MESLLKKDHDYKHLMLKIIFLILLYQLSMVVYKIIYQDHFIDNCSIIIKYIFVFIILITSNYIYNNITKPLFM